MKLKDRVLEAVKHQQKFGRTIADECFVSRDSVERVLMQLVKDGAIFKKFAHNKARNCPDYIYSSIRFPKRYHFHGGGLAAELVGGFDVIDFSRVKK